MRKLLCLIGIIIISGCSSATSQVASDIGNGSNSDASQYQADAWWIGNQTPGTINCGSTKCNTASEICCLSTGDSGSSYFCSATTSCQGNIISCDEPKDCPWVDAGAVVCCVQDKSQSASCQALSACPGIQRCQVDSDCNVNSIATKCCPSATMSGGSCKATCSTAVVDSGPVQLRDSQLARIDSRPNPQIDAAISPTGNPSPGQIVCGNATCANTTSYCCATNMSSGGTYNCVSNSANCTGSAIKCDEPGDCPTNQVCCRDNMGLASTCTYTCNGRQRCHVNNDCKDSANPKCCPSAMSSGGTCRSSSSC